MALKGRKGSKALQGIKELRKGVKAPATEENPNKQKERGRPLPKTANVIDEGTQAHLGDVRKTKEFEAITIYGSKGEQYTVAVPASYVRAVPKVWEWTAERYKVAELIAQGVPFSQIPDHQGVNIKSRMIIYCWLEHPEFKSHVDGLVLETGWANRRERMTKIARLNEKLLDKVLNELDKVQLSDKMAGALLSAISANAKMLAQEKGEFVEESKVTQDTNITGTVTNVAAKLEDFVQSKSDEEKKELEKQFDEMGNDIIRSLTGSKDN